MKVFIIPYTFHTFFHYEKRVSGVDEALLKQIDVLREMGHSAEVYIPFGNLHEHMSGIHFHKDHIPAEGIKSYVRKQKNKNEILKDIIIRMIKFNPDVILSNAYMQKKLYIELQKINKPIAYMSHAIPGFFTDIVNANQLSDFSKRNSIIAVSDYHSKRFETYYGRRRKGWTFENTIEVDSVVFSSYSSIEDVQESDGIVRHVSAAHKEKQTFFIHDMLNDTEIKSEVYTTLGFMAKDDNKDLYVKKAFEKYNTDARPIFIDVNHKDIMEKIKKSSCCFVGLATYDTFTITSLESLSRGVPIIVKGHKGNHPAKEMIEPEYQKYVHIYDNKDDFRNKVEEFSSITLSERKAIAQSCYNITSKNQYGKKLESALDKSIIKYKENANNCLFFQ